MKKAISSFFKDSNTRNSFCECPAANITSCDCACVEGHSPSWVWSQEHKTETSTVSLNQTEVFIHEGYSKGTGCVRGDTALDNNSFNYWEIKYESRTYGSSMMIGVCTENFKINAYVNTFVNMLGKNAESWGLDHRGFIYENDENFTYFEDEFTLGSVIGILFDPFAGTLTYYLNRESLGVAFSNLQGKVLYPVVSSTSAFTSFRLIYACNFKPTLFTLCSKVLTSTQREALPDKLREFIDSFAFWDLPKSTRKKVTPKRSRINFLYGSDSGNCSYINEDNRLIDFIKTPKIRRLDKASGSKPFV